MLLRVTCSHFLSFLHTSVPLVLIPVQRFYLLLSRDHTYAETPHQIKMKLLIALPFLVALATAQPHPTNFGLTIEGDGDSTEQISDPFEDDTEKQDRGSTSNQPPLFMTSMN